MGPPMIVVCQQMLWKKIPKEIMVLHIMFTARNSVSENKNEKSNAIKSWIQLQHSWIYVNKSHPKSIALVDTKDLVEVTNLYRQHKIIWKLKAEILETKISIFKRPAGWIADSPRFSPKNKTLLKPPVQSLTSQDGRVPPWGVVQFLSVNNLHQTFFLWAKEIQTYANRCWKRHINLYVYTCIYINTNLCIDRCIPFFDAESCCGISLTEKEPCTINHCCHRHRLAAIQNRSFKLRKELLQMEEMGCWNALKLNPDTAFLRKKSKVCLYMCV